VAPEAPVMTVLSVGTTPTTGASPIVTKTDFNYEEAFGSGLLVNIRIRKSSQAPFYKTSESTGTITSEGLNLTVKMILDQ